MFYSAVFSLLLPDVRWYTTVKPMRKWLHDYWGFSDAAVHTGCVVPGAAVQTGGGVAGAAVHTGDGVTGAAVHGAAVVGLGVA
eukprot:12896-Heterococcus_DN1.PRE.2